MQPDHLLGKTLDRKYRIDRVLGKGGMGTVYLGKHIHLHRDCAIKVVRRQHTEDPVALKRFKLEAEAASMLKHPNIIEVYDFGITEDELSYIVMEYLPGESLDDVLQRHKYLHYEQVLKLFLPICDALAHAHDKNVLHRDLKPPNIMLTTTANGEFTVKLVDFGIAKLLPGTGRSVDKLTQTGEVFGSPLYMSPEQCMGQALDFRSDIYAFGCLLYEALTGRVPFEGESLFHVIMQHVNADPMPFSDSAPDIAIPKELEKIVMRCMSKERELRFDDVRNLRKNLEKVTSLAHRDGTQKSEIIGRDESNPGSAADDKASTDKTDAESDKLDSADKTARIFPIDFAEKRKASLEKSVEEIFQQDISDEDRYLKEYEYYKNEYGPNCRFLIDPLTELYFIYYLSDRICKAVQVKEEQIDLLRLHMGDDSLTLASAYEDLAHLHLLHDEEPEAERAYNESLAIKTRACDSDSIDVCKTLTLLAQCMVRRGKSIQGVDLAENALMRIHRDSGKESVNTAIVEFEVANTYFENKNYETALKHFEQALELRQRLAPNEWREQTYILIRLVSTAQWLDEYYKAIEYSTELIKLIDAAGEQPSNLDWEGLASSFYKVGKLKEAERTALNALEYLENADFYVKSDMLRILELLIDTYKDWGLIEKVSEFKERLRKIEQS